MGDDADVNTCVWDTKCIRPEGDTTSHCPSAGAIYNPAYDPHPPAPTSESTDKNDEGNLASGCPFLSMDDPVCCGSDNLEIIATNFRSLDAVFNEDCPVCAVNLKVMWCLYGCSPI